MFDKEPVDIFDSTGTNPPEEEDTTEEANEEEDNEDESEDEESDDESADDESEDEDDDSEDEDGEEGDDEDKDDPKQAEIDRLKGLLKTKNQALRKMRRGRVASESGEEFKPPYPDLKRSHELPKEEQDEMTEREKKLHDDNIDVKERLNADAKATWEKEQKAKAEAINEDALTEDEAEDFVKASALYLAKGDKKIANQIIRKYNQFNNEGLTEEQIEDRLGDAAKLVKGFTPAREQGSKKGKAVKKTKSNKEGDIDAIVEKAAGSNTKKPIEL